MTRNPFKTIRMRKSTDLKLSTICKALGKSKASFLGELVDNIAELLSSYDLQSANICYESRLTSGSLTITFSGARSLVFGVAKDDSEMEKKLGVKT